VRVGLCIGVPPSVLFDALISRLPLSGADPVPILEMLSCLVARDRSVLPRAIDARTALGDAEWLKLLSAIDSSYFADTSQESVESIRDCVTPLIEDVDTDPERILGALDAFYLLVEIDGRYARTSHHLSLLNIPDLTVHFIRLLHHPASDRVQLAALKVLSRSFDLRSELVHTCLRRQMINLDNFGHFCHESMVGERQEALRMLLECINESKLRPFYMDCLPLLVRILCSIDVDTDRGWISYDCLSILAQCVTEFGRPAVLLLKQADIITPLIESIWRMSSEEYFSNNLHVCDILAALLQNDIREHGDDGATLHPWMVRLVESEEGLPGLEGSDAYTCRRMTDVYDGQRDVLLTCVVG
jgi:hypothetical protein